MYSFSFLSVNYILWILNIIAYILCTNVCTCMQILNCVNQNKTKSRNYDSLKQKSEQPLFPEPG